MTHSISRTKGFTRVDLVSILAVVSLLLLSILPVTGKSRSGVLSARCLSNQRLLMQATLLSANDNDGWLPPNSTEGGNAWVTGDANAPIYVANSFHLSSPKYSALAFYLGGKIEPFKCPSDTNAVKVGGNVVPSLRSVSMNGAVGTKNSLTGSTGPRAPVDGPWLTSGHVANKVFYCYGKVSDAVRPKPSDLWVLVDEAAVSINDGSLAFTGPGIAPLLIDWPATYHDYGAGFGFMDGHAEIHSWQTFAMTPPVPIQIVSASPTNADVVWLAEHGTSRILKKP